MQRVMKLAKKGEGSTSPNPLVGAVIVKDEQIVGEGYHRNYGGPHAEVFALNNAGTDAFRSNLYVNLEPCNHYGKTPPCVDRVIESGVSRVIISNQDPNSMVKGAGLKKLQEAGISIETNVLADDGEKLNEAYFKYVRTGKPFVILKWAQSLDGRIATRSFHSTWISNEKSRKKVHQLRKSVDAVLIGAGTVKRDDPQLTVRHVKGNQPWRIVVSRNMDFPFESKLFNDEFKNKTVVFTANTDAKKINKFKKMGVNLEFINNENERGSTFSQILEWMSKKNLISLLVEGGKSIITSFIKTGLADKLMIFVAPKLIGEGIDAVGDLSIHTMMESTELKMVSYKRIGTDILIEGYLH